MSRLTRLYRIDERAQNLAQEPWRPQPGGMGWSKRNGLMAASVTLSRRGDGSYVVSSLLKAGTKVRRQSVPVSNEAEALARGEAMKLELDGRSL